MTVKLNSNLYVGLVNIFLNFWHWKMHAAQQKVECKLLLWVSYGASIMMTSWNGNIYRVTGPLCLEFTSHQWIPLTKASNAGLWYFLACSRACASKVFSLRADCGRVIVYPGLKQWERPRHNIFGVCTRLAGGVCMSTSANSSASKHLTVTKIVWKIVYVTFDYLISHFFKILSLEFMANLFRDFRASVSLKVFHYRLRGKWCQYDLEIN